MALYGRFVVAMWLAASVGCNTCIFAKRTSELNCPTDVRKTVPWYAGQDAIFQCPCGPSGAFYGHRPTCWRTWPTSAEEWRDMACGTPPLEALPEIIAAPPGPAEGQPEESIASPPAGEQPPLGPPVAPEPTTPPTNELEPMLPPTDEEPMAPPVLPPPSATRNTTLKIGQNDGAAPRPATRMGVRAVAGMLYATHGSPAGREYNQPTRLRWWPRRKQASAESPVEQAPTELGVEQASAESAAEGGGHPAASTADVSQSPAAVDQAAIVPAAAAGEGAQAVDAAVYRDDVVTVGFAEAAKSGPMPQYVRDTTVSGRHSAGRARRTVTGYVR